MSDFSRMLEQDVVRILSDYLVRYGEPAIYFPQKEKTQVAEFGEKTRDFSWPDVRLCTVFCLQANQMPFQRYGLTVEEGTLVFSLFPFSVDDRVCLLRRHIMRQGVATVADAEEVLEKHVLPPSIGVPSSRLATTTAFLVPSLLPLSGEWQNRQLNGGAFYSLFAHLPPDERPPVGSKVQVSYYFAMCMRIKSFASSWRIDDSAKIDGRVLWEYPTGERLSFESRLGRFVYVFNATVQDE